jgi:hypothetical protein
VTFHLDGQSDAVGQFQMENLLVTDVTVSGARATLLEPFLAVGPDDGSSFAVTSNFHDGYECPGELLVTHALTLDQLGGSGAHGWSGSFIDGIPAITSSSRTYGSNVAPGLYALNSTLTESGNGDEDSWLSRYLSVDSVVKTGFAVPAARTGQLWFDVTTSDVGVNPITDGLEVVYRPDGSVAMPGASRPYWSGCLTSCDVGPMAWDLAGTYVVGLSYKVSGHEHMYHDNQARWGVPGACTVWIPASANFYDSTEGSLSAAFAAQAGFIDGLLAGMPSDATATSFYSPRHPVGTRGGVVPGPSRTTALEALQADHVVSFNGHGWHNQVELSTTPAIDLRTSDVQALPAGSLSQLRLVALHCCAGLPEPSVSPSIGEAMYAKGAQAVWGYEWYRYQGGGTQVFEDLTWEYLADEWPLSTAILLALADTEAQGYDLVDLLLEDNPVTPELEGVRWLGSTTRIAPAF